MISWSVIEQRAYPIRIGAVAAGLYRVLDGHRPGSSSPVLRAFAELWDQTRRRLTQPRAAGGVRLRS